MTRFTNKIWPKTRWVATPHKFYSQRFLRIMSNLQETGAVLAHGPDEMVDKCDYCGNLYLGRDHPRHKKCFDEATG